MAWLLDHPMLSIIIFNIWRGTAFSMMLYAAALANVPPSHLETARLAGASTWQQLRDVVFPHIRGHVLTNTLLISLWTFNDFTPFLITAGGPSSDSEILPVYIYKMALSGGELGFGAAISLIMLLINLVIALVYLRLLRERRRDRPIRDPRDAKPRPTRCTRPPRPGTSGSDVTSAAVVRRIVFYVLIACSRVLRAAAAVAGPRAVRRHPDATRDARPDFTLDNFRALLDNPYALPSLVNSV